jgi:excisionase family DNA binding protein
MEKLMPPPSGTSGTAVLKVAEVAERLRCGDKSVYKLIKNGNLRAIRVGRLIYIPAVALDDFLGGAGESLPHTGP